MTITLDHMNWGMGALFTTLFREGQEFHDFRLKGAMDKCYLYRMME
jgi:hypothetical protein